MSVEGGAAPTLSAPRDDMSQHEGLFARGGYQLLSIISPLALLLLWDVLVRLGVIDARFFPAPSTLATTLWAMAKSGELWSNTQASLIRLFWGFLVGGIPALGLGIAMGLSPLLRAIVEPLIAATYPIPKSAIMPLILLIFGLGEASKIAMVAIGVFFPVAMNAVTGVLEINKIYLDVGRNCQASRWQVFRTIALPGALPFIMTGIKLGVGLGLILVAISEMLGAKSGLGYLIWNAWQILDVNVMYVGLFMIALIGFLFTHVLNALERWIVPWKAC
jgi:ABC-type nitrate/sulfonate/bicarbonate transport system permease component